MRAAPLRASPAFCLILWTTQHPHSTDGEPEPEEFESPAQGHADLGWYS